MWIVLTAEWVILNVGLGNFDRISHKCRYDRTERG